VAFSSKKLTAIGAAAVLALGVSACSSSTDENKIVVWHYYSLDNQVEMLNGFEKTFEAANEGVNVENVYIPQDQLNSKLIGAVGTSTGPDVVIFDGYSATSLAASGALAPLDDYVSEFADAGQISEGAWAKLEDKTYSVQSYVNTLGLYYNKSILDEVGAKVPTNQAELEEALALVSAAGYEGLSFAGQPDLQGAFQANPWLTSAGFSYESPNVDSLTKALTLARNWVEKGYVSAEVAAWDQNTPFSKFMLGKTAFAENGNWQLATLASDAEFEYGIVPMPFGQGTKIYLGGEAEGIASTSKNKDLAWKYLEETFLSKEGQLQALDLVGSIPTRADAASEDAVAKDPYLNQFSTAIADQGTPFPDSVIPPKNTETVYAEAGTMWSLALSGQAEPAKAAAEFVTKLDTLLK